MSLKYLKPKQPLSLWWLWEEKIGQPLEGYYMGSLEKELQYYEKCMDNKSLAYQKSNKIGIFNDKLHRENIQKIKTIIVYNDALDIYYKAIEPQGYNFNIIPTGCKVIISIKAIQEDFMIFEIKYDEYDKIPLKEGYEEYKEPMLECILQSLGYVDNNRCLELDFKNLFNTNFFRQK